MFYYERENEAHADLLLNWWFELQREGELGLLFDVHAENVAAFMRTFDHSQLYFACDEHGMAVCAAFDPMFSGAGLTLWVAKRVREGKSGIKRREAVALVDRVYREALKRWPVILGLTREELIPEHVRVGYDVLGVVKGLKGGKDVWVVVLYRGKYKGLLRRDQRGAEQERGANGSASRAADGAHLARRGAPEPAASRGVARPGDGASHGRAPRAGERAPGPGRLGVPDGA